MTGHTLGLEALEPDGITREEHRRLTPDRPAPITPRPPKPARRRTPTRSRSPQRACTLDGCDRPHEARGLCSLHYQRWRVARRRGELDVDDGQADELDHPAGELDRSTPPAPGRRGSCGLPSFLPPQDFGKR